jgi:hypothetical protein
MNVMFRDMRHQDSDRLADIRLNGAGNVAEFLRSKMSHKPPFFAELVSDNGVKLLMGLGGAFACTQFSAANGAAPYWMALGNFGPGADMEFLMGNTITEVPGRFAISSAELIRVASYFAENGERDPEVRWEEI